MTPQERIKDYFDELIADYEDNDCNHVFENIETREDKYEAVYYYRCYECKQERFEVLDKSKHEIVDITITKEGKIN